MDDQEYLKDLLEFPAEARQRDYKAAVKFQEGTDFSFKLVRHVLGFANSGGGHIVIGYKEIADKSLEPGPGLTDEISSSYEVTRLCQFVERFITGQERIEIIIHKKLFKGKKYPILCVYPFPELPFVCTREARLTAGELELESGIIYVRVNGARTMPLKSPSDWRELITRCVAAKENREAQRPRDPDEGIGGAKVEEPTSPPPTGPPAHIKPPKRLSDTIREHHAGARESFQIWLKSQQEAAQDILKNRYPKKTGVIEFWLEMPPTVRPVPLLDLLSIAEKAECHNTGWPIGVTMTRPEYKPTASSSNSIKAAIPTDEGLDYWALHSKGHFYFVRTYEEDREDESKPFLWFDIRIWRIAESLLYSSNLTRGFNVEAEETVNYFIAHSGLMSRRLDIYRKERTHFWSDCVGTNDKSEKLLTMHASAILPNLKEHVWIVCQNLLAMFDLNIHIQRGSIDSIVDEFLRSRI